ncbi:MAG: zinc-ribbon domain-containing protein [Firmicutes bacterium]|nr:zinc-ribbon domain-containing protein [Bacillota bacterium]
MFCSGCGNPISQNMRFCPKCGRQLIPGAAPTAVIPPAAEPPAVEPGLKAETALPLPELPPLSVPAPAAVNETAAAEPFSWYAPASVRVRAPAMPGSAATAQVNAPAYAPRARVQNPYNHPVSQPGYHGKRTSRTWLIVLLSLLAFLVLVAAALFTYSYIHHQNASAMGQGYSTPNALIGAYYKSFEAGDEDAIAGMLPKPALDYFHSRGYTNDDVVYHIDSYYDGYGGSVSFWAVSGQSAYQISDYNFSEYGIRSGAVSSFVDFSCTVTFDDYGGDYPVNFDLAQIGGSWYLIQVW